MDTATRDALPARIRAWGAELGFQQIGITGTQLGSDERRLNAWLARGMHGEMDYMERHGIKRSRPAALIPGTLTVICARMNYLPSRTIEPEILLDDADKAYIAHYALGRDYHKVLRKRLQTLATRIAGEFRPYGYRVFTDSAPVLERALARNAGLGWIGKHSNLINREEGSWFFIGEIYTDLKLPVDPSLVENHCGTCTACIDVCPTQAIVAPYTVDARRCISYLTIEFKGVIPASLRPQMGNRVFGCDDCQIVCPWNKFARVSSEPDFRPRHGLDSSDLVDLFNWTEPEFEDKTRGSPLRRISHDQWLRNLAVGLGNAPFAQRIVAALTARLKSSSSMVSEHIGWALRRQQRRRRQ